MYNILRNLFLAVHCFALCSSISLASEDYRTFTSQDGATIEAKITACDYPHTVSIQRRDGSEFKDVSLSLFSIEDRGYARKWVDAQKKLKDDADLTSEAKIDISVHKGRDEDMNDYGDVDDRVITFEPGLVIDSRERNLTYQNVKGTLVVIGRGIIQDKTYAILDKQDFVVTIRPLEQARWDGKAFSCRYDPDYGGFEYSGYLLVLRNKAGQITIIKGSKSVWEKNAKGILKAKKQTGYNREFFGERELNTTFGLPE